MSRTVEAWGGPRDGETFIVSACTVWNGFVDGYYSLETLERRQHRLIFLHQMLRWHQSSAS